MARLLNQAPNLSSLTEIILCMHFNPYYSVNVSVLDPCSYITFIHAIKISRENVERILDILRIVLHPSIIVDARIRTLNSIRMNE